MNDLHDQLFGLRDIIMTLVGAGILANQKIMTLVGDYDISRRL